MWLTDPCCADCKDGGFLKDLYSLRNDQLCKLHVHTHIGNKGVNRKPRVSESVSIKDRAMFICSSAIRIIVTVIAFSTFTVIVFPFPLCFLLSIKRSKFMHWFILGHRFKILSTKATNLWNYINLKPLFIPIIYLCYCGQRGHKKGKPLIKFCISPK